MIDSQKIREIYKKQNLTQGEVAAKVGISQSHLSYIESGKKDPSLSVLQSLALVLHTTIDDLLTDPTPAPEPEYEEYIDPSRAAADEVDRRIREKIKENPGMKWNDAWVMVKAEQAAGKCQPLSERVKVMMTMNFTEQGASTKFEGTVPHAMRKDDVEEIVAEVRNKLISMLGEMEAKA
jgi:transcriptional regulator with XRE-family HTH domain